MTYRVEKEVQPGFDRLVCDDPQTAVLIKRLGAEVIGYDVWDQHHRKTLPLLWNNNRDDIPFEGAWKNHATILFPVVGGLKDGRSRLGKREILSPANHGFARRSVFTLAETSTDDCARAVYRLSATTETRKLYPFDFVLELAYVLKGNTLSLTFHVRNTDSEPLLFQFGWHPGFNTELTLGGRRSDWEVSFPQGEYIQYHVLPTGDSFLTGEISIRRFDGKIEFTDDELYCTLMYEIDCAANRRCRLYNPKLRRGVEMTFHDFPHLGLWANKGQDYLCIEPWQGMDDHDAQETFDRKVGILSLPPGQSVHRTATILPIIE